MTGTQPIEPVSSTTLLDELRSIPLSTAQVALVWLGQAGFALQAEGQTILLDPFLSEYPGRRFPPTLTPDRANGVSVVLITHDHVDHLDGPAVQGIAAASPEARFVVPVPAIATMESLGIDMDRVIGAQPGHDLQLQDLAVHPVPAMHGMDAAAPYTFGHEFSSGQYAFLGYVVEAGGVRVYHAGDTIRYEGMEGWLTPLQIDVGLLPINGRDAEREAAGIVGNMDHLEAAHLSAAIGVDVLIPMHFDMFAGNRGYPERAVSTVTEENLNVAVVLPRRGSPFIYTKPAGNGKP